METRIQLLQEALVSARDFSPREGLTFRKIGLQEEALFSMAGLDVLNPAGLEAVISAITEKRTPTNEAQLQRAAFICSQEPERMRRVLKSGTDAFEDAFFSWLGTLDLKDLASGVYWMIGSVAEIAASLFKTNTPGDSSKNAQTPAAQPS